MTLKECDGCQKMTVIWKNSEGFKFCRYCWSCQKAINSDSSQKPNDYKVPQVSSKKKKKDFEDSEIGLKEVMKLKPKLFRMKTENENSDKHLGFIAQEVKELVPNAVTGSEDEHYQMDYSKLVTHLVKGMKEQQEQIEFLKEEIANLKGE